ncbi:MAG: ABC transporter substrate-binding protein [Alcaligenaceae bacterium]
MKINTLKTIAGLAFAGMAFTSQAVLAQDCEVKIGAVAVLSGPAANWGQSLRAAVAMNVREVNDAGGLKVGNKTCKVSFVALDSKYTAEGAAAALNELASQGIKLIVGPLGSPEVTGGKPVALRNSMLMMSNSYAKDAIGPKWPLVFYVGPGASGWADPIIAEAKARFKITRAVVVAPNDQGGTDIASVDAAMYKKNGIEVSEEYYQRGTTNFAPIVLRILSKNPDAIDLASSPGGDAGTFVKQLRQAGFKGVFGRLGGPSTDEIVRIAGGLDVVKNMYWYEPILRTPAIDKVDAKYKQMFNQDPPAITFFYQWLAGSRMVMKAIEAAGTADDTAKVAEAMRKLPVDDPDLGQGHWIGQDFFGINQEMSHPFGVGLIADGKYLAVVAKPAATGK